MLVPLFSTPVRPSSIARLTTVQNIDALNIAGNCESKGPGIGARVEAFLARVFAITQREEPRSGESQRLEG
jgi:hypothetical protein